MTREQFITRQLTAWKVPRTYQGLILEELHPDILAAIPDAAITATIQNRFPESFGICGIDGAGQAFAALLRQSLESFVSGHPEVIADEELTPNRHALWVDWTSLFGELVMEDAFSEAFKATASIFERMGRVKVLILTGLGNTPETPPKLEAAMKGILTRRFSDGLRTYWESPLLRESLIVRYGCTGINMGVPNV